MALTHLVDTSVLSRVRIPVVRAVVAPLLVGRHAARVAISDLEIGFSARDGDEWDRLAGGLDAFELVPTIAEHFTRAGQVQRQLAERGLRGRKVPDLLIAAAAELKSLSVLHYDRDFDRIAEVTGQQCQWVVPAGTID